MKKIIILILAIQIGIVCFASQVTTFSLPSPKLFDASKCDKVVKIYFNDKGNFIYDNQPVDRGLITELSQIPADFTKTWTCADDQKKQIIEENATNALKEYSNEEHGEKSYNCEQAFTAHSGREVRKNFDPIYAIRGKPITIEGDPCFTFNQETLLPNPINFSLVAGSEKYIIDFTEIRKCDHMDIDSSFQKHHYHIAKVIITHQQKTIFSHPLWQPILKWSAVTLIGCGALAAGYLAYHKWLKK